MVISLKPQGIGYIIELQRNESRKERRQLDMKQNHQKQAQMENQMQTLNYNTTRQAVIVNSIRAAIGLAMCGTGLYLTIQANIGVTPWDCLYLGIHNTFGFQYGNISVCVSLLVIGIDLLLKERIGVGTLIDALLVGKVVDLWNYLDPIPAQSSLVVGILLMLGGLLLQGFGQYVYMSAGLCCGPRDALLVGLSKRLVKVPLGAVSMLLLGIVLLLGWLLGGPVGIGTLIGTLLIGPILQTVCGWFRFVPEEVPHQDLLQSAQVLTKAGNGQE